MSDLINRQDAIDAVMKYGKQIPTFAIAVKDALENLPSAQPELAQNLHTTCTDTISRQAAIDAFWKLEVELRPSAIDAVLDMLKNLPSAQPERKKWTTEEVAEILFNAVGDDCACNFNGIDEWLPERCKYTYIEGQCPNPKEKHGCWMQFLIQGKADMRGGNSE